LLAKKPELKAKIIAEDLGDLRPQVLTLRDHYDFPGMNVIEFTFTDAEVLHKPASIGTKRIASAISAPTITT
jgi:4-alpha-glucanotransferase